MFKHKKLAHLKAPADQRSYSKEDEEESRESEKDIIEEGDVEIQIEDQEQPERNGVQTVFQDLISQVNKINEVLVSSPEKNGGSHSKKMSSANKENLQRSI